MASKRQTKKSINYIASELFTECLVHSLYIPGTDKETADKLMNEILNCQNDYITRISHIEPGNVKGFFKKLKSSFNDKTDYFIDAIDKLNKNV